MSENNEVVVSESEDDQSVDYLSVIEALKNNTVDKKSYERVVAENKRLLQAYVNGEKLETSEQKESAEELRKKLFGIDAEELDNLQYCKAVLELRETVMENGGNDPFIPIGFKVQPDQADIAAAQRVADVFQQCIDYADGDNGVFTNELQRRMIDMTPQKTKKRR